TRNLTSSHDHLPSYLRLRMKSNRSTLSLLAPALIACLGVAPRRLIGQQYSGGFVALRGADTVVVERFTRTASSLTGTLSPPGGGALKYTAKLRPDASVERIEASGDVNGTAFAATAVQV